MSENINCENQNINSFINLPENEKILKIQEDINFLKRECFIANVPLFVTVILNYQYANDEIPFERLSDGIHPMILDKQPEKIKDTVISNCMKLLNGWSISEDPAVNTDKTLQAVFDLQSESQNVINKNEAETSLEAPPI